MGIQGMTNWKFTAFLTIALMLVAGLFSNAAMASDGQGTIVITTITPGTAAGNATTIADGTAADLTTTPATPAVPAIVSANGNGLSLEFTYTVAVPTGGSAINMDGGLVEIAIPSGWTVPHASVSAADGAANDEALFPTDSTATGATDVNKRIVLTKSGDNATKVGVKLTGDEWSVAVGETASLTITLASVTTATPSSLHVPAGAHPYREYTFRTRSMAKGGSLRSLVIADNGLNPQPRLRVGVVTAGKGQLDVSPIVYESEADRNISLVFTAQGPMYDYTDATDGAVDSTITITIPDGLTAPQTDTNNGDGFITVSRQSGTVLFKDPNAKITVVGQVATIDITRMENNAKIYVAYRKVDVIAGVTAARFALAVTPAGANGTVPTVKPDGNHVRTIAGSGEIKLTKDVVEMGTKPTLTFVYKAATKLTDAVLVIDQPGTGPPAWTDLVLQSGDSRADNYVSISGGGNAALDLDPDSTDTNQNLSGDPGDAITLRGVDLNANASVTVRITRITLTGAAGTDPLVPAPNGVYAWPSTLNADTDILADPMLYVVGDDRESVTFQIIPTAEADHNAADPVALPHYNAASKENIRFQFATTTPIKGGYVQFSIPSGWAAPSIKDVKDKATVKLVGWGGTPEAVTLTTPASDADMTLAVSGNRITVNIVKFAGGDITVQYGTGTGDNQGMVQNRAVDNLEIVGRFKTGSSSGAHPAAAPVSLRVGNVAAGSGTAMITSPASHKVEAGSDNNNITIVYRAAGTMNGGTVRLRSPANWGTLQETDATKDNHVRVAASSSMVNQADISYGPRYVLVPLKNVEANNTVSFMFSNVKAQTTIGIAEFTIESAGGPSGNLMRLEGEALPKDADDKNITDRYMLLGKVYVPRFAVDGAIPERIGAVATANDVTNDTGVIRLEVVAGAGGTGEATLLEIVRSDAGLRDYLNADGDALVSERQVHAGDTEIYLVFKYAPVETITDGALQFTVPSDWTEPQEDSSNTIGYTRVESSGANTGAPAFSNQVVTIPIVDITSSDSIEIHYGSGSFGATAPKVKKTSEFRFAVKGTSGSFQPIGTVKVDVGSQASGRGSASVEAMNATAGAPDGSITITYDPEGQIANGRVKLTVPDALTGGADGDGVTASHISVRGSAKYGGGMSDADLKAYGITKNDVLVSNVNLRHDGTLTFTYEGMMPEVAGDIAFTVAVDGGEGPDEKLAADGAPTPMALIDGSGALTVTIGQAAAGSGSVMIAQEPGAVVAGSSGNKITVTYTAIGEIGAGKKITVVVPDGWSAPLNEAAADEKMGTFTAKHYLKLLADDADGMPDAGDAVAPDTMKATGAAADAAPMIMVATVAADKMVKAGDMVKFTYSNAMAPDAKGPSYFTTQYDGMSVGEMDDVKVIVQSMEGATQLSVAADDFNIDGGGSTTVTIKLLDSDGDVATVAADTTVTLTASSGTIAASVTIPAGEYMATTDLSATAAANITVTATADLDGDPATDPATATVDVHADTDDVEITDVSLSESFAKAGDTVMVTATGTPAQMGRFSVGSIVNNVNNGSVVNNMDMEGDGVSYTGSFTVVADLHEGMHTVTVSLNGASDSSASITIDTVKPTVTASGPTDAVGNGDMVTITAMPEDAAPSSGIYKVMADVSELDTTQTDMVELMMGDDGSYSAEITISEDNEAANDAHDVTVTATDMAGNMSEMATVSVTLNNELTFTSQIPAGLSLFHVPLDVEGLDTVGDLEDMLQNENFLITVSGGNDYDSQAPDREITADLGIIVSMGAGGEEVTFTGYAWGNGTSMITLEAGSNLIGLPLDVEGVDNASDIAGLFDEGVVSTTYVISDGDFMTIFAAGDAGDGPVTGDAGYQLNATAAASVLITGAGWENGSASAAPIALSGYTVDTQTPVLDVRGSVVDEITGLAKEGFRVKVKNLSTKAALSDVTSVEASDGYNMTFVDLVDAHAARVGDVLEITADSPDPLIGIKPVRHIVTVDDVKNSRITLEELIAYEIPAETALLRNYPNPFNPETWIPYHLSEDADVKLTIYDVNGALVRDIYVGHQTAAKYDTRSKAVYWDGRNQFGEQVASGIYFYSLSAGDFSATRKMVILK